MKKFIIIILVIVQMVTPAQVATRDDRLNETSINEELQLINGTSEEVIEITDTEKVKTKGNNPCSLEDIEDTLMPDFNVSGRRISEIKCKEYVWTVENSNGSFEDCAGSYLPYIGQIDVFVIAGGHSVTLGEFPHMGAIGWKKSTLIPNYRKYPWIFKCGSSLISRNFILTAAHCTKVSSKDKTVADPYPKIVRLGVADIENADVFPPRDFEISRIIVHPQYKAPKQYYDIALMELKSKLSSQFEDLLHPACLWPNFDVRDLGGKVSVTGWGGWQSTPIQDDFPSTLQVGDIDFIDSQLCDDLLSPFCNRRQCGIQDHQICAGRLAGGVDACQGDSGGPLNVEIPLKNKNYKKMYYVVGVTSYGFGCAVENTPGVYTRVSSFIDWIEDIVWPQ